MGIAFLKMDRSRIKWRYKLAIAFEKSHQQSPKGEAESQGGKWALFMLPFITVLREGLEAVVFVGGVRPNLTKLNDHVDDYLTKARSHLINHHLRSHLPRYPE